MLCSSKRLEVHLDQLLLPNPTIGGFSTSNLQLDLATKFQSYQESKFQDMRNESYQTKLQSLKSQSYEESKFQSYLESKLQIFKPKL